MTQNEFITSVSKLGITLTTEQLNMLNTYKEFLQEYNKHTNLTRIVTDEDIYLKHFYDSLTIVKAIDLNNINNLLDIGTGAGFPGMVLKIVFPKINVTLLDSNNKKIKFLQELSKKLNINVEIINDRVENYVKNNLNKFDIVTSRAVANMRVLTEISLPLVKVGGYFIALKGIMDDNLEDSRETIAILNGEITNIITFNLHDNEGIRNIIVIKKKKETQINNLRTYDKIIKKPLKK